MAVMTDPQRFAVWAEYMREELAGVGITKADLRAAINAADLWISDNSASFNTALPQPARGALTAPQKARLLSAVVLKRWKAGT